MTDTNPRDLIKRLADELDHYRKLLMDDGRETHALAAEARAYLAQLEPEESMEEEWQEFLGQCGRAQAIAEREGYEFPYRFLDGKAEEFRARWGRPPQ